VTAEQSKEFSSHLERTKKAERARAIHAGDHYQQLSMLAQFASTSSWTG
jgi:hypothetical protein